MKMNLRERRQLKQSEIALLMLALLGFAVVVWLAWLRPSSAVVNSYESCMKAGNPVQASHPSVCVTTDGKHFTNPTEHAPTH